MTSFKSAVQNTTVESRTANNMKTYESSLSSVLDLFFAIGSSRGKDIIPQFEKAYQEDRRLTLRAACWARDVRGGAGERETFRKILSFIEKNHNKEFEQLIKATPFYGRWDDVLVSQTKEGFDIVAEEVRKALSQGDGLCAKWMPRKGVYAVALRKRLNMSPKQYRKTLVTLTNVVEQSMCSGDWSKIVYDHVPSVAAARYQKAFGKHDPSGYAAYREALTTGDAKVNAGAVYPYDIIKSLRAGGAQEVIKAQWEALPNYVGDANILPMVDVSGSMACPVGGNANLQCIDVAVSLGLYLADKNRGAFKDMFLTFSSKSKIEVLKGDIVSKFAQLSRAHWDMSTNLLSAFDEVLRVASEKRVAQEDMPRYILILSDMEFNQCTTYDDSAIEGIRRKYAYSGYTLPNIIFWTLNARSGNVPVKFDERGTALVSGFSPAIMTSILKCEAIDPTSIMLTTLNSERYERIQ